MRWISKPLQPLTAATGALAALLCLAATLAAPAADPANSAPATLLLRNGDSLDGNLVSIDARQVLRWKHADVAEPIEFKLDRVSRLDLRPSAAPERATNYPCKVSLTQGDALEGSLVSCNRDTLCLQTWYAGPLSIPRRQVQSVYFFPATPDIFMITGPEGWTQGSAAGALANAVSTRHRWGGVQAHPGHPVARRVHRGHPEYGPSRWRISCCR